MNRRLPFLMTVVCTLLSCTAFGADKLSGPWTVKVLVLKYFPVTPDRQRIDVNITSNVDAPLDTIRRKVDRMTRETAENLMQGSRFRAYNNPAAEPSIVYEIVAEKEYLEPIPHHPTKNGKADYVKVLERDNVRDWVENKGVREIWIWGYHSRELAPWESNMAGPHGDVSNSDRDPRDLPVLKHTYTVYHYNYERETSEAVHNHIHQIEAVMRKHGGALWRTFEGKKGAWRAGNCHFPPNGERDYDWDNKRFVDSDIEDWRPEGFGRMQRLNSDQWQGDGLKWFVYWMRSIPGMQNGLKYRDRPLTNWWIFMGDYDLAMRHRIGTYEGEHQAKATGELLRGQKKD